MTTTYWCELAWLGGDMAESGVLIEIRNGTISAVLAGVAVPPDGARPLPGLTLPGFVNGHSHSFHRALRARAQKMGGSFWSWREAMYDIASKLDPDALFGLARATFAEMALAGITTVGEFHYLHYQPDGMPYDNENILSESVIAAAHEAGIRITLLDACYLRGGFTEELSPVQLRFSDRTVERWVRRVSQHDGTPTARIGAAVHSVRAVGREDIPAVVEWANSNDAVLHAHVSEQPAENAASMEHYGRSPVEVFAEAGALSNRFTAVHATHLSPGDIGLLGAAQATCCFCPTTERDLADGIGPSAALVNARARLSLGSDSHAIIDMTEEARAVELHQRLVTNTRGTHSPASLLTMATHSGAVSLGWPECGEIRTGAHADLTTLSLDSVRMVNTDHTNALEAAVFAATAADVTHVLVGGREIVVDGAHTSIDVAAELRRVLEPW